MKNLFDYATKELSQDAFLRWLFESWKDEEIKPVVKSLLKAFCNLDEEIHEIKTTAQEKYIDIKVDIETISQRKISLFIEDKTFSNEHKQLKKYDEYINGLPQEVHKVFYKTNKISDDDQGINEVNKENKNANKSEWQTWDIDKIVALFKSHEPYQNLILRDYVKHIEKIRNAVNTRMKPEKHESKFDFLEWEGYFNNVIKPQLDEKRYKVEVKKDRFPYVWMKIRKQGANEGVPYLEITSKECLGNEFVAKILLYDVMNKDEKKTQINALKQNIGKSLFKLQSKGKQTIAKTKKGIKVESEQRFIEELKKYANEFLDIINDWY